MTTAPHPLTTGYAPTWAWGWGEDEYGVFTEIKIGEVVQRMRWIPEGTFWMGSPEDEKGREADEGRRHEVTLTEGYWLADTPCTQALWLEVMDRNPSMFLDPERPVENIDWIIAQQFLWAAEDLVPGLGLKLPTEAQWERACRAGTEGVHWLAEAAAPEQSEEELLNRIAWFYGNKKYEFDLKGYPEGTRKVAQKECNPWGLYDMLGNVAEWCADRWDGESAYPGGARVDPMGEVGRLHVLRGGSWSGFPTTVRAAFRGTHRGDGSPAIGFRISRGP